jgi:hypothetical protein
MKNLTTEEITRLTREVNEGRKKKKNLTFREELEEELFDLVIYYEELPKGTHYAEELYEELLLLEGMLRSVECGRASA